MSVVNIDPTVKGGPVVNEPQKSNQTERKLPKSKRYNLIIDRALLVQKAGSNPYVIVRICYGHNKYVKFGKPINKNAKKAIRQTNENRVSVKVPREQTVSVNYFNKMLKWSNQKTVNADALRDEARLNSQTDLIDSVNGYGRKGIRKPLKFTARVKMEDGIADVDIDTVHMRSDSANKNASKRDADLKSEYRQSLARVNGASRSMSESSDLEHDASVKPNYKSDSGFQV